MIEHMKPAGQDRKLKHESKPSNDSELRQGAIYV